MSVIYVFKDLLLDETLKPIRVMDEELHFLVACKSSYMTKKETREFIATLVNESTALYGSGTVPMRGENKHSKLAVSRPNHLSKVSKRRNVRRKRGSHV